MFDRSCLITLSSLHSFLSSSLLFSTSLPLSILFYPSPPFLFFLFHYHSLFFSFFSSFFYLFQSQFFPIFVCSFLFFEIFLYSYPTLFIPLYFFLSISSFSPFLFLSIFIYPSIYLFIVFCFSFYSSLYLFLSLFFSYFVISLSMSSRSSVFRFFPLSSFLYLSQFYSSLSYT